MAEEQKKLYVAIDVGCHECGVESEVIGAFWAKASAEDAVKDRDTANKGWRDGGQTIATVFEIEVPPQG